MRPAPAETSTPVGPVPPTPAIAAAVLACLSAFFPGFLVLIVLALSEGAEGVQRWLPALIPAAVGSALVVGALLLVFGRSWLALVVPSGVVSVLAAMPWLANGASLHLPWVLAVTVPLAAAVLGALPVVRRWVRSRRTARGSRSRS